MIHDRTPKRCPRPHVSERAHPRARSCSAGGHGTRSVGNQLSAGGRQWPGGSIQRAKGSLEEAIESVAGGADHERGELASQALTSAHAPPTLQALPVFVYASSSLQQPCVVACTAFTCSDF